MRSVDPPSEQGGAQRLRVNLLIHVDAVVNHRRVILAEVAIDGGREYEPRRHSSRRVEAISRGGRKEERGQGTREHFTRNNVLDTTDTRN